MKSLPKLGAIALAVVLLVFPATLIGSHLYCMMGGDANAAVHVIVYAIYAFIIISAGLALLALVVKKYNFFWVIVSNNIIWGFLLAFSYYVCERNGIVFGHGGFNVMILNAPFFLKAGAFLTFIQCVVSYVYLSRDKKNAKVLFFIAAMPFLFALFLYKYVDWMFS